MADSVPREIRSAAEYAVQEDQADAIVRVTSYHREDFCRSVIWFPPHDHDGVRQSIVASFPRTPVTVLGSLHRLPLELLHHILSYLDMNSVFKFRQANLAARQTADSLKQYRMVASHGLNLLHALLRTRLADEVSLLDCYDALCTKACTFCGGFAGFISLLTWSRCCFKCLHEAPETHVQSLASIRKQFRLTKTRADQLRSFKSLSGVYSTDESSQKSRITIASVHQAALVSGQQPVTPPTSLLANSARSLKLDSMGSCALPYYDKRSGRVENGMSCAGCQLALETDMIGSRGEKSAFEARNRAYSRDGFLEHFRWCGQVQLLWRSSDEGRKKPPELPELARRGGHYLNNRE